MKAKKKEKRLIHICRSICLIDGPPFLSPLHVELSPSKGRAQTPRSPSLARPRWAY